ncbi:MAG: DeoR/GlpR family DNA-binding transcription regulator [Spirochaetia bacterium]|jgi:DeoR/GlpR family transcriptional regulator of sugar metabolism
MNKRQRRIIDSLNGSAMTSVNELSRLLNVSAVTIRQDLTLLEEEGFLRRVHGGAVLVSADDISKRLVMNYEKKQRIARAAAEHVGEGESIFIEAGSTNAILVKELGKREGVTIITSNVFIARQLKKNEHASIILLGGLYQHESESLVGKLAKLCLDNVNFTKAFIGVDGFTKEAGFTSTDMMRAEISAQIVRKGAEVFVVTDSSKFGKVQLTNLFYPRDIRCLITDDGIPPADKAYLEENGVRVIIA